MSRYRFIQGEQAAYPITLLCRVLDVARSAYYAWARCGVSARAQADAVWGVKTSSPTGPWATPPRGRTRG